MEFKGTKGKWNRVKLEKTDFYTERNEIHYGVDGECVAEFVHDDYDALLISKAPEMLEMLSEIVENYKIGNEDNFIMSNLIDKSEQLIKEATELN